MRLIYDYTVTHNEAMDHTQKIKYDGNYMKMVQKKNCWLFQTKVMNIFQRS